MLGVYEKRRQTAKAIPKFWPVALMNHSMFSMHATHTADQVALSYLEDLWLVRDETEGRCFTLEFVSVMFVSTEMLQWLRALRTVLQGEPVLFKYGLEKGIQVHSTPCGLERDGR